MYTWRIASLKFFFIMKLYMNGKKAVIHFKPLDFLILLIIVFFAVFSFLKTSEKDADKILVTANGDKYIFPINKNSTYEVQGKLGITKIEVKDNQVRIIDSPCPNKTCIAMGYARVIICLPNDVMIQKISSGKKIQEELDGIAK